MTEVAPLSTQEVCGLPCSVYSRVVGYFRPVQNWNEGKREEFRQRKNFDLTKLKELEE